MNVLYIIGNGFDINLGLKTKYFDFYEYYNTIDSTELISDLKETISEGLENWSDLELAFGRYMSNLTTIEEFDELYEDIVDNLGEYLEIQEQAFDPGAIDYKMFLKHLFAPEATLSSEDRKEIDAFSHQMSGQVNINIITFNYTRTLEKIFAANGGSDHLGSNHNGRPVVLVSIEHIHGFTDSRTIMGVNDITQIANPKFHQNREILEAVVKPNSNNSQRHNVDRRCELHIKNAQLICIFGSSLGDTDNHWWDLIGKQLRNHSKLIIFIKGEEPKPRFGHKPLRTQRKIRNHFLSKTDLSDDEKEKYGKNIYVGINTSMFNMM